MKELWIDLQPDSPHALYEQIYEYIRKDIADGKISPGEKLPSTRFMAKNLQISRSTVELAYEQLTAEGYIEPKPCAGYFVCDISMLYQLSRGQEKPEEGRLMERQKKQYEISFSPYEIDRKHFPYGIWYRMHKSVVPEDNPDLLLSGNPKGELNLRTAISRYLYQARGVVCDEKQILLGAGNEYLLLLLAQIMGRDKKVAMENYTYLQAYYTFCNMGYRVLAEEIDEDGICMEAIRKENPDTTMEVLIPDFQGRTDLVQQVIDAGPEVISHNLETVRRLSDSVRSRATYEVSLKVIGQIAASQCVAKSGIMLGLGETREEILETMDDLRNVGCQVMTIGQYLQPTAKNTEVKEYIRPEVFEEYKEIGLRKGFTFVESGPLVRSSYHAERHIKK